MVAKNGTVGRDPRKYSLESEYKVDISSDGVQKEIMASKELYASFMRDFRGIDLANAEEVEGAYDEAVQRGILDSAERMRNLIFGKDMTTYGVSYISDGCVSTCAYCPIRADAVDVETGRGIPRKKLSEEDFIADTKEIIKDGHSHICFLTGDGPLTTYKSDRLIPYLKALDSLEGIDEIILNVTPQSTEMFKRYREAVKRKSLQFRVFQETYDRLVYADKHARPSKAGKLGPKANYGFRRESQARAMDAGFDNYGLGILLGLNHRFLEDLDALVSHATELTGRYGKAPARVCLPTANTLAGVNNVETEIRVSPHANELAYALAKLAMPETSIVSSERDTPEMLRVLDRYASDRTVDVQPSVGGNLDQLRFEGRLLKQTTVYPGSPEAVARDYEERGYRLLFRY